jgi:hypothetical protein
VGVEHPALSAVSREVVTEAMGVEHPLFFKNLTFDTRFDF